MNFAENLYEIILNGNMGEFDVRTLAKKMKIYTRFEKQVIADTLAELASEGKIVHDGKGTYSLPGRTGLVRGVLSGNPRGFGFVTPENGKEDIFVPVRNLNGALHGDSVWVRPEKTDKGISGRIVSVISRGIKTLVGRFEGIGESGFVVPDDEKFSRDVFVRNRNGARIGDKVVVEITAYPKGKNPEGKITEIIGHENNPESEMTSIVRANGFATEFPPEVIAEANRLKYVTDSTRVDMTEQFVITIDGDDAKDFDDAVSVSQQGDKYLLSVHIADVSEYVRPGSAIDKEALKRATSVYYPEHVIPMLPEALSNNLCSLREGEVKATLSVDMLIDKMGKVVDSKIYKSIIKSSARMTYNAVSAMLDGDKRTIRRYEHVYDAIIKMSELADILTARRKQRGSIDFNTKEALIRLDGNGKVISVERYPYTRANAIIEEFMLVANETVAEFMCRMELPFIYRVHEKPSAEKLDVLKSFVNGCGLKMPVGAEKSSTALATLVDSVKGTPLETVVSKVTLRSMQKARYQTVNLGHYGLSADFYCHFTSPIRRYPDLFIHRIIKLMLDGKLESANLERYEAYAEQAADVSSERERAAETVERDIDDVLKAHYMEERIGEEYDGTISGVTQFGFFVELDNTVEGLVHVESLRGNFRFIEEKFTLIGGNVAFRLGDRVRILVDGVDTENGKIRFSLAPACESVQKQV